ncbi:MAG: hypothetical protein WKG01_30000 [Kofleriaceae bacterium]
MRSLLLIFVLAGCWTGSTETTTPTPITADKHAPAPGLVCAEVVAHALEVSREELARSTKPDQIERIRVSAIDTCLATRWSQELLACFNDAKSSDGLGRCQSQMTREQNDDMQKRLVEALQDGTANPCGNPCAP